MAVKLVVMPMALRRRHSPRGLTATLLFGWLGVGRWVVVLCDSVPRVENYVRSCPARARARHSARESYILHIVHTTIEKASRAGVVIEKSNKELFVGDLDGAGDDSSISGSLQSLRSTLSLYPFSLRVN